MKNNKCNFFYLFNASTHAGFSVTFLPIYIFFRWIYRHALIPGNKWA